MPNYDTVSEHKAGDEISLRGSVRVLPGYDFDKWISSSDESVAFSNPNSVESTFTMPDNDVTITATFKMNSGHPSYPGNSNNIVQVEPVSVLEDGITRIKYSPATLNRTVYIKQCETFGARGINAIGADLDRIY